MKIKKTQLLEVVMNSIRLKMKRMRIRQLLIALSLSCAVSSFFLLPSSLFAAFEDTPIGGRPTGLGGAYAGLADDVYSIYYNPAGLALMPQSEFAAQYSKLFVGLDDNSNLNQSFLALGRPLKYKRDYGTIGAGWLKFELAGLYQENTFFLTYAKYGLLPRLSVGVNLKYLKLAYGEDSYTRNAIVDDFGNTGGAADSLFQKFGNSVGRVDLDLGAQMKFGGNYKVGLMVQNITEPNLALQDTVSAPLPRTFRLGVAHTGPTFAVAVDGITRKVNQNTDWEIDTGAEKWFKFGMVFRGGVSIGSRELANVAAGIGYEVNNFHIDYAIVYPLQGIKDTMGNHRISLKTKFGPVMREKVENEELLLKIEKEKEMRVKAEKELVDARLEIEKLRKEIEELLKRPVAPVSPMPGIPEVSAPAEKGKPGEAIKKKPAGPATTTGYIGEMNSYRRSGNQMTIPQRIDYLKNVVDTYKGKVNTSDADTEYMIMVEELKAQKKYYRDSLTYYKRMVNQGITADEQTSILKKMISKYEAIGIDVSEAKKELGKVQAQ
ncbi:MAG: type IX secretion system membrane protein PorP/SprF [Elusimicrobiota bacterium]